MEEPAGAFGGEFAGGRQQLTGVPVFEHDTSGHKAAGGEGLEGVFKEIVPAERMESHGKQRVSK